MEQRSEIALVSAREHEELRVVETARRKPGRKQRRLAVVALVLSDILLALVVWEAAHVLQGFLGRGEISGFALASIVPSVAAWVGLRAVLGLYPGYGLDWPELLRRHTYAVLVTAATTAVFAVTFQVGDLLSRLQLAVGFLGLLFLAPLLQYLVKWGMRRAGWRGKPVMILGSRQVGNRIAGLLREEWQLGYDPVAILEYRFSPVEDPSGGVRYEQGLTNAADLARGQGVDTIIFATPYTRREQLAKLVAWASGSFRHVLVMPNLSGVTNSAVTARNLAGTFAVEIRYNLLDPWALRTKRALDLGATMVGGILVLPLVLLLALLVYLESRGGPVFYNDKRMGRDGRPFSCVKFRTMVPGAEALLWRMLEEDDELREEYSRYHKLKDDPRVTRVGRFLRKSSLDELPQLWNVLKGEMSLVGPRPYLSRESEKVGMAQSEILRVPPGITGPWQVSGRNHTSFDERVQMDAYYVRDWSVWLDLVILARTVKDVIFGRGAY